MAGWRQAGRLSGFAEEFGVDVSKWGDGDLGREQKTAVILGSALDDVLPTILSEYNPLEEANSGRLRAFVNEEVPQELYRVFSAKEVNEKAFAEAIRRICSEYIVEDEDEDEESELMLSSPEEDALTRVFSSAKTEKELRGLIDEVLAEFSRRGIGA